MNSTGSRGEAWATARHAVSHIEVPEDRDLGDVSEDGYADAASSVWAPIVGALVDALETAYRSCADPDRDLETLARARAALGT